jgi:hypothetical protein
MDSTGDPIRLRFVMQTIDQSGSLSLAEVLTLKFVYYLDGKKRPL